MAEIPVIKIDKPHFIVKLHEDYLELDLKEGAKKELEDIVEAHPGLRESIGILFQTIIPLDVALHEIEEVEVDKKGHLKIAIPLRRDIIIPLDSNESKRLADKMNELIPLAKQEEAGHARARDEAAKRPRRRPRGSIEQI